jgi:hypothetical protein
MNSKVQLWRRIINITSIPSSNHYHSKLGQMPESEASIDLSSSSSNTSYDEDEGLKLAQKEWEESLEQLQQLVAVVLLPFFGKWLGRRWSHWGASGVTNVHGYITYITYLAYDRYLRLGLGKSFILGARGL